MIESQPDDPKMKPLVRATVEQEKKDYHTLVTYGHSPTKAAEIVLDASRGNEFAIEWIKKVKSYG